MYEKNLVFIDGMLWGMSLLCRGCDFMPNYGAMMIDIKGALDKEKIYLYCSDKKISIDFKKFDKHSIVKSSQSLSFLLRKLIKKWIVNRIFEGRLCDIKNAEEYVEEFTVDLIELIEDVLKSDRIWHVSLEGEDFGLDSEGILVQGKINYLIYFGFEA